MQRVATLSKDTLKHARGTARNVVEAYRLVAHRGVALERQAVSAGIGYVGTRLKTDGQVLASVGRMNRDVTGFATTVVDGAAEQANAIVDGVARVAEQIVVKGLNAVPPRIARPLQTVALPVMNPVRDITLRIEGATVRVVKLVGQKPRAGAAKRAKRTGHKRRAR
ncbi:MAG: hypothetical protein KJ025_20170 [Burkholderiales bacterium]|nr:hypothetical protein [Burkholderiales bacterium]